MLEVGEYANGAKKKRTETNWKYNIEEYINGDKHIQTENETVKVNNTRNNFLNNIYTKQQTLGRMNQTTNTSIINNE